MKKILVCGDRNWTDEQPIRRELAKFAIVGMVTIIHGAARGADSIAGEIAEEFGLIVKSFPADWNKYGKAAGPIRNLQMLNEGKPDLVLAFHEDISKSKGTKNMVEISQKAGIEVKVFDK